MTEGKRRKIFQVHQKNSELSLIIFILHLQKEFDQDQSSVLDLQSQASLRGTVNSRTATADAELREQMLRDAS